MTKPDKRKRRRSKKVNGSVEEPTGAVASKASALDRPREVVETGADALPKTLATELRAAAGQLSAGTAVAVRSVDTLAGADKPSGDTEPITLADETHSRCTSTSLARREIGDGVTNIGSLEFFPESASRDGVTGTSKGGALSTGQTSLVTDISTPSSFAATERWRTVDRTQQLAPYPSPSLSGLLQTEDALRIMSSVLLHCASQHHRIGKFGGQDLGMALAWLRRRRLMTFMNRGGLVTCLENQQQCRGLWKTLFNIRRAGVEMIACYRTAEFNKYCKTYLKRSDISLIDTIVSWEKAYRSHIGQLESRDSNNAKGIFQADPG